MSEGYDEDLVMYEGSQQLKNRQLDRESLLRPISEIDYPRQPVSYPPDAAVGDVLAKMAEKHIGAVLIVENGKLVGIFAERDLLIKRLYDGQNLDRPVRDFMTPDPDCLTPDDPIAFGLNRMVEGGYRHVPLIRPNKTVAGILIMRDVIAYVESFFPVVAINVPPHSEYNPPDREREGG
jgi:CBS domain-containing protein